MPAAHNDLYQFPFLAEVWGTVADWLVVLLTVAAVMSAVLFYRYDKRNERRNEDFQALRTWLPRFHELAEFAESLVTEDDSDGPAEILTRWNDLGVNDPQRAESPVSVLIRELSGRLVLMRSAQVGYPAIVSMTVSSMIMWINRAHTECASWISAGPPSDKQLRDRYTRATDEFSSATQALFDAYKSAQERAAAEEEARVEMAKGTAELAAKLKSETEGEPKS